MSFQGWVASLSNGQTVHEDAWIEGRISPWQELLKWLRENPEVRMTQLRLQLNGATFHCIPKAQGYFQGRRQVRDLRDGFSTELRGVGTVVDNQIFINWANEQGQTWQEVALLDANLVHTTLA